MIQVLARIGKILSKIVFICCLIGVGGCLVGAVALSQGAAALRLHGLELGEILWLHAELNESTLYVIMAVGLLLSAGEAVLARFAVHYFEQELKDGTPFTRTGARELLRLGILTVAIPLTTSMLAEITQELLGQFLHDATLLTLDGNTSVGLGLAMILVSLLCSYGATLRAQPDSL